MFAIPAPDGVCLIMSISLISGLLTALRHVWWSKGGDGELSRSSQGHTLPCAMKIGIVGLARSATACDQATKLGHDVHVYDPASKVIFRFRHERDLYDWCDAPDRDASLVHIAGIRACAGARGTCGRKAIAVTDRPCAKCSTFAASKKLTVMVGNNLRLTVRPEAQLWLKDIGKPLWRSSSVARRATKPLYLSTASF